MNCNRSLDSTLRYFHYKPGSQHFPLWISSPVLLPFPWIQPPAPIRQHELTVVFPTCWIFLFSSRDLSQIVQAKVPLSDKADDGFARFGIDEFSKKCFDAIDSIWVLLKKSKRDL
ncbi:hypothetical protein A2U01_0058269, partial [Trifolium medium]|nr:hypothetical protein [Trifolium medium]